MSDITCPECGEPCNVVTADNGIGSYEYWGAPGFDSQPFPASDCCEAEIEDAELPEPDYESLRDEDHFYHEER